MTINTFDKTNLVQIRKDLEAAFAEVSKKHGIDLSLGSIGFTGNRFSGKLTATTRGEGAEDTPVANAKWKADFLKQCHSFAFNRANITPADFGTTVKIGAANYKIVGAQPRKANVIVEDSRGKFLCYPVEMISKK